MRRFVASNQFWLLVFQVRLHGSKFKLLETDKTLIWPNRCLTTLSQVNCLNWKSNIAQIVKYDIRCRDFFPNRGNIISSYPGTMLVTKIANSVMFVHILSPVKESDRLDTDHYTTLIQPQYSLFNYPLPSVLHTIHWSTRICIHIDHTSIYTHIRTYKYSIRTVRQTCPSSFKRL